jgi:hypothetical protein
MEQVNRTSASQGVWMTLTLNREDLLPWRILLLTR